MTTHPGRTYYLLGLTTALGTLLLLVLAAGALGIIGDGGRSDRGYAAVLMVAVVGALIARLRPAGMAWTSAATAVVMVLTTAVALAAGLHREENASVVDLLAITAMYAGLFALSGWLFHRGAASATRRARPRG